MKKKIGVVGGTGYTGVELLRLLSKHPNVEVVSITSRSEAGKKVSDYFANLQGFYDLNFSDPKQSDLTTCDLVFFATPNAVAMYQVPELLEKGVKVIDLAADFRIKDIATWEKWYATKHHCPETVTQAVYGLPELFSEQIKSAQLVANPGCYATAVQLALIPLLEQNLVDSQHLIASAASGVSGAGRGANIATLFSEVNESYKAYAVSGHRHLPEIKQQLEQINGAKINLNFTPHLIPMTRGIHATVYAYPAKALEIEALQNVYQQRYQNEPFVEILPFGSHPETRMVRHSNRCLIACHQPEDSGTLIILSVIDNLIKGAAGQAVQNMNIMFGFDQTTGIDTPPVIP